MSLVNRVSAFFLAALAIFLIANSVVFYGLARYHLQQQFDEQLQGALRTLVAAVEVEPDDVKFEPADHAVNLGKEDGLEDVRWVIIDEQGLEVARSENLNNPSALDRQFLEYARSNLRDGQVLAEFNGWGTLQSFLAAPQPKPVDERDELEHDSLTVTVGRSSADLNATLGLLALLVVVLPAAVWLSAFAGGRWFCAKALRPVKEMALQTRRMTESDFGGRLPVSGSNDELADLGRAFNTLLDRVSEAFDRQRRFTGDAAHQLRTPISVLVGQIDVALRRPRTSEEYVTTLNVLKQGADELRQIVVSLLFLAGSETDAPLAELESLEFCEWFASFRERWRSDARCNDLRFEAQQPLVVQASPLLLGQLLENLINNALKYSRPGSPVVVEVEQQTGYGRISVVDQGVGIAAEDLEKIFQPFYRSHPARQMGIPGTGLGLAIAARIARALGGELTCESVPDRGSRFTFTLPLSPAAAAGLPQPQAIAAGV